MTDEERQQEIRDAIEILDLLELSTKMELSEGVHNHVADKITVGEFFRAKNLAIATLRAQLEPGWIKVTPETMPCEGQKVEIRRTSDYYMAIYRPSKNQFIPWELLDDSGRKTMLLRRREVVDEWRPLPEPPNKENKQK